MKYTLKCKCTQKLTCDKCHKMTCAICYNTFKIRGNYIWRSITQCGHQFHTNCLYKWFDHNNTCPMCRIPLIKQLCDIQYYDKFPYVTTYKYKIVDYYINVRETHRENLNRIKTLRSPRQIIRRSKRLINKHHVSL